MAETILFNLVAALFGYAFGHRGGFHCCLDIMRGHFESGMTYRAALEYEEAVAKGEVPRG